MIDIHIRKVGYAGRITLQRPDALNAMTYDMCLQIDAALRNWKHDDGIKCVVIDALGERAFCAGGDIADLYATGMAGDYSYGQKFWAEEYHTNALIAAYPVSDRLRSSVFIAAAVNPSPPAAHRHPSDPG